MPATSLTCPFCNALVPMPDPIPASGRVVCPRCGDFFPLRDASSTSSATRLEDEVARHRQARQSRAARSIRMTLIAGLCLGVLGVAFGLAISRWGSRENPPSTVHLETAKPVAPLEMPGLAYLPQGTDSVVALQLRAFVDVLPEGTVGDPVRVLADMGMPEGLLKNIDRITGLGLGNIDQLVIGLKLEEGALVNQAVLVVHTRQSYSIKDLADRLNARTQNRSERTYYRAPISPSVPLDIVWWSPNDRVLVATLNSNALDAIPAEGHATRDHLSPRLTERVTQLLPEDTLLWAVLDSKRWEAVTGFFDLFSSSKKTKATSPAEWTGQLRTAVLGVRIDDRPILTAWLEPKTEKAAIEWRELLSSRLATERERISVGGAGNRVMLRLPATSEAISTTIQRLQRK